MEYRPHTAPSFSSEFQLGVASAYLTVPNNPRRNERFSRMCVCVCAHVCVWGGGGVNNTNFY